MAGRGMVQWQSLGSRYSEGNCGGNGGGVAIVNPGRGVLNQGRTGGCSETGNKVGMKREGQLNTWCAV